LPEKRRFNHLGHIADEFIILGYICRFRVFFAFSKKMRFSCYIFKPNGFDSQLGHTKDFKNGICCFSFLTLSIKNCAEDKETVSGLYVSERKIISAPAL